MTLQAAVNQKFLLVPGVNDTAPNFSNLISGVLANPVSPGATTIDLVDATNFSDNNGMLRMNPGGGSEEFDVSYTGKTGNQLTGVSGVINSHSASETVQKRNVALKFFEISYCYEDDAVLNGKNDYILELDWFGDVTQTTQGSNIGFVIRHTAAKGFVVAYLSQNYSGSTFIPYYVKSYDQGTDTWTTLLSGPSTHYAYAIERGTVKLTVDGMSCAFLGDGYTAAYGAYQAYSFSFDIPTGWESGRPGIVGGRNSLPDRLYADNFRIQVR